MAEAQDSPQWSLNIAPNLMSIIERIAAEATQRAAFASDTSAHAPSAMNTADDRLGSRDTQAIFQSVADRLSKLPEVWEFRSGMAHPTPPEAASPGRHFMQHPTLNFALSQAAIETMTKEGSVSEATPAIQNVMPLQTANAFDSGVSRNIHQLPSVLGGYGSGFDIGPAGSDSISLRVDAAVNSAMAPKSHIHSTLRIATSREESGSGTIRTNATAYNRSAAEMQIHTAPVDTPLESLRAPVAWLTPYSGVIKQGRPTHAPSPPGSGSPPPVQSGHAPSTPLSLSDALSSATPEPIVSAVAVPVSAVLIIETEKFSVAMPGQAVPVKMPEASPASGSLSIHGSSTLQGVPPEMTVHPQPATHVLEVNAERNPVHPSTIDSFPSSDTYKITTQGTSPHLAAMLLQGPLSTKTLPNSVAETTSPAHGDTSSVASTSSSETIHPLISSAFHTPQHNEHHSHADSPINHSTHH